MYKVRVYDQGWVTMCELDMEKKDYVDCVFETREEAQKEADEYTAFFGKVARVVEI